MSLSALTSSSTHSAQTQQLLNLQLSLGYGHRAPRPSGQRLAEPSLWNVQHSLPPIFLIVMMLLEKGEESEKRCPPVMSEQLTTTNLSQSLQQPTNSPHFLTVALSPSYAYDLNAPSSVTSCLLACTEPIPCVFLSSLWTTFASRH